MTTARVLIVDDVISNVRLLEAKLRAEYFEVATATDGATALERAKEVRPDIILLDIVMPKMDGYEACRRLKADPETEHIPIIMITALSDRDARLKALEAGADDFLVKPPEDVALFARVRNLVRLKVLIDELRLRDETRRRLGVGSPNISLFDDDSAGNILLLHDDADEAARIAGMLERDHGVSHHVASGDPNIDEAKDKDLLIVDLRCRKFDALRVCSAVRSRDDLRQLPIMAINGEGGNDRLVRAFELGVNDYVTEPIDEHEIAMRVRTQLRRKRYADGLRASLREGLEMAVIDQLTGLHNRRYLNQHLEELVARTRLTEKPLSLIICDIDHFKSINDEHGHLVGDDVLKQIAGRLVSFMRGVDLACRFGGEEFVIVMPDTNIFGATVVAERLRRAIAEKPFAITGGVDMDLTSSFGVASAQGRMADAHRLLTRADSALYKAKQRGRNAVVASSE